MAAPYKTRRHQIRAYERKWRAGKISATVAMEHAAFCAVCGERDRTIAILKKAGVSLEVINEIYSVPVSQVPDLPL